MAAQRPARPGAHQILNLLEAKRPVTNSWTRSKRTASFLMRLLPSAAAASTHTPRTARGDGGEKSLPSGRRPREQTWEMNIPLLPSAPFKPTGKKERKKRKSGGGEGNKNPRRCPAKGQNNEKAMNRGDFLRAAQRASPAPGAAGAACVCWN